MIPIRAERKSRGWTAVTMAKKLRAAAEDPRDVPGLESLRQNIHRWERGGSNVSERHRYLYCQVFGRTEAELFGTGSSGVTTGPTGNSMPTATDIPAGMVTSEDHRGNRYLIMALPPGAQRIIIDITSTGEGEVTDIAPRPIPRLAIVRDAEDTARPQGEANG